MTVWAGSWFVAEWIPPLVASNQLAFFASFQDGLGVIPARKWCLEMDQNEIVGMVEKNGDTAYTAHRGKGYG
jgi:hypothetical protein